MVTIDQVREAWKHLNDNKVLLPTMLLRSVELQKKIVNQPEIYLKPENLQRTGSYKVRGAYNRMRLLSAAEKNAGVVTASAGNHAQGVAFAASTLGIPCTVFMPVPAPKAKQAATRSYGVTVELFGDNYDEACQKAREFAQEKKRTFVHAFDDEAVIAGQGTVALEIAYELVPDGVEPSMVLVPAGGGGLLAGTCVAIREYFPHTRIIGVQSEQNPALFLSLKRNRKSLKPIQEPPRPTIADGIKVGSPGITPWKDVLRKCDQLRIVTVCEADIQRAILFLFEKCRLLTEGAGAVGVAALLSGRVKPAKNDKVVVVLSGGNIDITKVANLIESQLTLESRYSTFCLEVEDTPGKLQNTLAVFTTNKINIVDIRRIRAPLKGSFGKARLEVVVETSGEVDYKAILTELQAAAQSTNEFQILERPSLSAGPCK